MNKIFIYAMIRLLLMVMPLSACGVEAGNPGGGTKPKKGSVVVNFARVIDFDGSSFKLAMTGAELRSVDSDTSDPIDLSLATNSLELVGSNSDQAPVKAATADDVAVGTYESIFFKFDAAKPVRFKPTIGEEQTISFDSADQTSFKVVTSFDVTEGQSTDLLINLDARRSLVSKEQDAGHFVFKPRGEAEHHGRGVAFAGKIVPAGKETYICAYLYDPIKFTRPARIDTTTNDSEKPAPPHEHRSTPKGPDLSPRPSFATKAEVVKDVTVDCSNAFDRTRVLAEGQWNFDHLRPGTYDFRAFNSDGTWRDIDHDIKLEPKLAQ